MSAAPHDSPPPSGESAAIALAAAEWLARRDRGLSAAEQDAFLQWLSDDPRHRAALAKEEHSWVMLDALAKWQPAHSIKPNPDILAPTASHRRRALRWTAAAVGLAAAAAALIFLARSVTPAATPAASRGLRVIPRPERLTLPDGSIAELNHGGKFEIAFTAAERRVRLVSGELYVTVAKNPSRPFLVETDRVEVRALGTVFNVRRDRATVEVLVTEGHVQIETPSLGAPEGEAVLVASGERARIDHGSSPARRLVSPVSAAEIEHELAWRAVRLEFDDLPLAAVISEFNLRNAQQLVLEGPAVGEVRVSGRFSANQIESFVLLLEASFGITVDRHPDRPWTLRRAEPSGSENPGPGRNNPPPRR